MKNLYVIDAYNLIYRMFYAIPEMHTRAGNPVNAVYWVAKFLKQLTDISSGDEIVVASESGSNFREALYTEYKWTRDRMPDNLRLQIEGVFACFEAFGIPVLMKDGYEADDIIGTIAVSHCGGECEVVIVSSDKDLCQFVVDGSVRIYDAMKQKTLRYADVIEKFSVPPEQVRDYLAIVWDTSDNIPGIIGFGPKKAEDLLKRFSSLEGIYRALWITDYVLWSPIFLDHEKYKSCDISEKLKQWLVDNIENAFLSQKLATIETWLDISLHTRMLSKEMFRDTPVLEFLKKYEFRSLLPKEYHEEKLSLEQKTTFSIESEHARDALLEEITKVKKIFLATEKERKIAIGIGSDIYSIDRTYIEVDDFCRELLMRDIEIVGYDLKEDLKNLFISLEKPLHGVEGQGRLF